MPAALGSEIICNKSPKVWRDKHQAFCKVSNALLSAAFSDPAVVTVRRSLQLKTTYATMWLSNTPQFSCQATECGQKFNGTSSVWSCKNVKCACNSGEKMCGGSFVDLSGTINGATGGITIVCRSSSCNLKFDFLDMFPDGINLLECQSGECVDKFAEPVDTSAEVKNINRRLV